jgi:tetratricopeptide (TPR) repeat protein
MSPEQASLNNLDIDTRSDVYALGVLLYELLTGTTPVDRKSLGEAALLEILRVVREVEAPRPSARLSTSDTLPNVSANRGTEPAKLTRLVRGELDWIAMKALEKDRNRRYETANGLAADVQRYLAGEQVQAVPPSAGYRLRKFLRKHRGPVTAAGLVAVALVAGIVGTTLGIVEAKRQEADARTHEAEAKRQAGIAAEALAVAVARENEAIEARRETDLELHDNRRILLREAWEAGDTGKLRDLLDQMRPRPGKADLRGFETHYLDRAAHAEIDSTIFSAPGRALYGSNGQVWGSFQYSLTLAPNKFYGTVNSFDLATGKPVAGFEPIRFRRNGVVHGEPFLRVTPGAAPQILLLERTNTAHWADLYDQPSRPRVVGSPVMDIGVWDARTGRPISFCERLTPDMQLVAQGWRHGFLAKGFFGEPFDRDAKRYITQLLRDVKSEGGTAIGVESRAQVHDVRTGRALFCLEPHRGALYDARFSWDDRYIITMHRLEAEPGDRRPAPGGRDSTLLHFTVHDAATGKSLWSMTSADDWVGFSRDGSAALFGSWEGSESRPKKGFALANGANVGVVSGEGWNEGRRPPERYEVSGTKHVTIRDARTGITLDEYAGGAVANLPAWVDDRNAVCVTSAMHVETTARYYNVTTYQPPRGEVIPYPNGARKSGGYSLSRTAGGGLRVVDVGYGTAPVVTFELPGGPIKSIPVLPQLPRDPEKTRLYPFRHPFNPPLDQSSVQIRDRTLAVQWYRQDLSGARPPEDRLTLAVYDLVSGTERVLVTSPSTPLGIPFALGPDGTRVALIDRAEKKAKCFDTGSGRELWAYALPTGWGWRANERDEWHVTPPLFFPDGSRVVVVDTKTGKVVAIETATGRLVGQTENGIDFRPDPEQSEDIRSQITPDGRALVCAAGGPVWVIDTARWKLLHRLTEQQAGDIREHPFWLDDRFVLVRLPNDVAEVWDLDSGQRASRFELKVSDLVSACALSRDGSRAFLLLKSEVRVVDLRRGVTVLTLALGDPVFNENGFLSLSPDERALTVFINVPSRGFVVKRVFDARPLSDEELARAAQIRATQTRQLPPLPDPPPGPADVPPTTASDFFDRARLLVVKDPKGVVAAYRESIKLDPDYHVLHRQLAEALESIGDAEGAIAEYRTTMRLAPRDWLSSWQVGRLLAARGDHRGAAAAFREAIKRDPRGNPAEATMEVFGYDFNFTMQAEVRSDFAKALWDSGDLSAAESAFRDNVRLEPSVDFPATNLINFLLRTGKVREADAEADAAVKRLVKQAGENPIGSVAQQIEARQLAQRLAQLELDLGATYLWADHFAEAVEWSDKATVRFTEYYKLQPDTPDTAKALRWTHWNRAVALNWLGRGADALAAMELSLRYTPEAERLNPQMNCARYMAQAGDHKGAAKKVRGLIGKPPDGDGRRWFYWDAALAYALSVRAAEGDEKLQAAYAEEAIALLKRSVDAGFNDVPLIKKDPDLNPIRQRADFKAIVAELEKKFPPPKPPSTSPEKK